MKEHDPPKTRPLTETERYGLRVKEELTRQGMSQIDLGEIVGWSQSIVSDIVRGKPSVIPPDRVRAITKVLGIPVREQLEILGYLDPDEPEPGVAYVIRDDDPRKELLRLLEDASPESVRQAILITMIVTGQLGNPGTDLLHELLPGA